MEDEIKGSLIYVQK